MKRYKSIEFLSIFKMSSSPTQTRSPLKKHKALLLKTFWQRFWCNIHTIWNLECCKCARRRFHYANGLEVLRICAGAHLRGNTGCFVCSSFNAR